MPAVGDQLRQAREASKLTVQQVAEATKMRTDHVIALEEGDYSPFPAPVYIRGSVRTYAKLVQLDVMKIMDDLTVELNQKQATAESWGGAGARRGIVDRILLRVVQFGWKRSLIVLGLALVILAVWLIRVALAGRSQEDPLADLPPPAYQPPQAVDEGYLPLPSTNR